MMTPIDQVLNWLSTCLKLSRGSPVKHFREMTDASKVVIRGKELNKLESSSPNDALCQVWLKLAQWFWRRR